jgi:2-keto-4-pentenoate hydratase/2-oxohepta-3-ene-1,7-dioic acid hydratase in catechol pathway
MAGGVGGKAAGGVSFALATIEHHGRPTACVERDGKFYPLGTDLLAFISEGDFGKAEKVKGEPITGRVLTPLHYPGKVLCAGANYYDHIAEMGVQDLRKEAQRLFFFFKPPRNALVGPGATVQYPADSKMFDWEVELAAVIGKRSKRLTMDNALDAVAAWSVAIDFSARDLNQAPNTFYKLDWVAGKGQDTCCPLGPRLVPARFVANPQDLALKLSVNGEVKQNARTSGMIFDIREQLVILSSIMTLDPGDVVLTGTPAGVGFPKKTFLKVGDRVSAEIESIGRLDVEIIKGDS